MKKLNKRDAELLKNLDKVAMFIDHFNQDDYPATKEVQKNLEKMYKLLIFRWRG